MSGAPTGPVDDFSSFVTGSARQLRRTAYLLTGDWHAAEDLVQTTYVRVYSAWGRISRRDAADAYARRTLVRLHVDERRRRRSGERVVADTPDVGRHSDEHAEDRLDLLRALATLPARQRAVLVLRFWEDLDVATVADLMDCPAGTVKSLTSRALDTLRARLAVDELVATGEDR